METQATMLLLLLQKALRVQQEPSQQLNDPIIRQCEKKLNRGEDQILGDGRFLPPRVPGGCL